MARLPADMPARAFCSTFSPEGPLSSEIEDGNSRSHFNMPILLAGTAGGVVQSGRHVVYGDTSVGQLFVSMLNAVGVEASSFGEASGPLSGLVRVERRTAAATVATNGS
jgi:hypothetical protein